MHGCDSQFGNRGGGRILIYSADNLWHDRQQAKMIIPLHLPLNRESGAHLAIAVVSI